MLCVKFYSAAVFNSAVKEFWPLQLEQRIKPVLKVISKRLSRQRIRKYIPQDTDVMHTPTNL